VLVVLVVVALVVVVVLRVVLTLVSPASLAWTGTGDPVLSTLGWCRAGGCTVVALLSCASAAAGARTLAAGAAALHVGCCVRGRPVDRAHAEGQGQLLGGQSKTVVAADGHGPANLGVRLVVHFHDAQRGLLRTCRCDECASVRASVRVCERAGGYLVRACANP
jgi:hypothetical protein